MGNTGLYGSNGQPAAPPYTNGPYTWDQDILFTGDCEFQVDDGDTGVGLTIDHNETNGAATGIHVDVASTGTQAFVMQVTGTATNTGVFQTNGVGTEANSVAAVWRVVGTIGTTSTTYYIPLMSTLA